MDDLEALVNKSTMHTKNKSKEHKQKRKETKKVAAAPMGALRFMSQERRNLDTATTRQSNLIAIIEYLQKRKESGKPACSVTTIEKDLKIKIANDDSFLETLQKHESVTFAYEKYEFKSEVEAKSGNDLINVLREKKFMLKSALTEGTFEGAEAEIKNLEEQGIIEAFKGEAKSKVYFYYDETLREDEDVLKAKDFAKLWHSEFSIVEQEDDLRDNMCHKYNIEPVKTVDLLNPVDDGPVEKVRKSRKSANSSINQKFL